MKKELIDHIKNELRDYETDYREGAWEDFRQVKEKRRAFAYWKRQAAAVLLILIGAAIQLGHKDPGSSGKPLRTAVVIKKRIAPEAGKISSESKPPEYQAQLIADHLPQDILQEDQPSGQIASVSEPLKTELQDSSSGSNFVKKELSASGKSTASDVAGKMASLFETTSPETQKIKTTAPPKWSFSFAFGQGLDNRGKTNTNTGIDIRYAFNSRLSLSTGVYYIHAGASKRLNEIVNMNEPEKRLTGGVTDLDGLDVPLKLEYRLASGLRLNAGVSVLPVINQDRTLQYTESKTVVSSFVDQSGNVRTETVTTEQVSEATVAKSELKRDKFVAFYNVSVGIKTISFKQHPVVLEPFIKIPVTQYSEQRFNLLQTGLQVKVGF